MRPLTVIQSVCPVLVMWLCALSLNRSRVPTEVGCARSSPPCSTCVLLNLVSCLIPAGLPWWPPDMTALLSCLDGEARWALDPCIPGCFPPHLTSPTPSRGSIHLEWDVPWQQTARAFPALHSPFLSLGSFGTEMTPILHCVLAVHAARLHYSSTQCVEPDGLHRVCMALTTYRNAPGGWNWAHEEKRPPRRGSVRAGSVLSGAGGLCFEWHLRDRWRSISAGLRASGDRWTWCLLLGSSAAASVRRSCCRYKVMVAFSWDRTAGVEFKYLCYTPNPITSGFSSPSLG